MARRVLVIGGGAAGLAASIEAARAGARVTLCEAAQSVGKSILKTGNGRCNFSGSALNREHYHNVQFVKDVEGAHYDGDKTFFESLGMLSFEDTRDGKLFPSTKNARTVRDVLLLEMQRLGVEEHCEFSVVGIETYDTDTAPARFEIVSQQGEKLYADAIIIATGHYEPLWKLVGHECKKFKPLLCPLKTEKTLLKGLSGIRVDCAATLYSSTGEKLASESGELLFRDYGVSGILIFNLSRYAQSGSKLVIDFFPHDDFEGLCEAFERRAKAKPWYTAESFFTGMLHPLLATSLLRLAGVASSAPISRVDIATLVRASKSFSLEVRDVAEASQAQVMRGGASVTQFDTATLESRLVRGLYAAGETLDVDGPCGGYNLHWAWVSGRKAGAHAACAPIKE